jgi:hypothetical protein
VNYANWTDADNAAADREGWNIFNTRGSASGNFQIQKDDEAGKFATDPDAWIHVRRKAAEGSELHKKALEIVKLENPTEYQDIMGAKDYDEVRP